MDKKYGNYVMFVMIMMPAVEILLCTAMYVCDGEPRSQLHKNTFRD